MNTPDKPNGIEGIVNAFEHAFPNTDSAIKSYSEYCAVRDFIRSQLSTLRSSLIEKLEAQKLTYVPLKAHTLPQTRPSKKKLQYDSHNAALDRAITIISETL